METLFLVSQNNIRHLSYNIHRKRKEEQII